MQHGRDKLPVEYVLSSERGQTITEYVLILGLLIIVFPWINRILQQAVLAWFTHFVSAIASFAA